MRIAPPTLPRRGMAQWLHERVEFWFAVFILSAAWFYYPYCQTGPTLCIWKELLGVSCPGCGLTRGVCFLIHGKWVEAIRFNPLSLLAVGILSSNILCGVFRFSEHYGRRKGRQCRGQDRSDWAGTEGGHSERSGDWVSALGEGCNVLHQLRKGNRPGREFL